MRNIDFNLGFTVDREKLARYISKQTDFHALLDTSFGYTGVNIKVPISHDITSMKLKTVSYNDKSNVVGSMTYGEYLKRLTEKERDKKLNKPRYVSFLIFHSGCCILSGISSMFMKDIYDNFINIVKNGREPKPHISRTKICLLILNE